jgi:hypothetical protein
MQISQSFPLDVQSVLSPIAFQESSTLLQNDFLSDADGTVRSLTHSILSSSIAAKKSTSLATTCHILQPQITSSPSQRTTDLATFTSRPRSQSDLVAFPTTGQLHENGVSWLF